VKPIFKAILIAFAVYVFFTLWQTVKRAANVAEALKETGTRTVKAPFNLVSTLLATVTLPLDIARGQPVKQAFTVWRGTVSEIWR
jgi:hypothetical protein